MPLSSHPVPELDTIATRIRLLALDAGDKIMEIYSSDFTVDHKDDNSPVTQADGAAEKIIIAGLKEITPHIPIVAEESMSAGEGPSSVGSSFWLVDPLDGTREFVNRNGDFTVNIALISDGKPVIGVVYAPAVERLFLASAPDYAVVQTKDENGHWTSPTRLSVRKSVKGDITAVASRSHRNDATNAFLERHQIVNIRAAGSSLKFCLVAAGEADIYPRFGPTMEWDTAAGHAVLQAAGGAVETPEGQPFLYGKPDFRNGHFIAWGRRP